MVQDYFILHASQKVSLIVSKKAFEDIVSSLPKVISGIKIDVLSIDVNFSDKANNVEISFDIKIEKSEKISEKINEIKNKIEIHCLYLIDAKPKNLIINYLGSY